MMNARRKRRAALAAALLVTAVGLVAGGFGAMAQGGADAKAWVLTQAAGLTGLPEGDLEVVSVARADYRALGEEAFAGKVRNRSSGEVYVVYVDLEGNAIDRDLAAEELAAKIETGPMTEGLRTRLAEAAPDELIPVAFWVPGIRLDVVSGEKEDGGASEANVAALAAAKESFLAEMTALGYEPDYVGRTSAAILATLPASAVESLAAHPDVVHVFLNEGTFQDLD
jgi:hypothetical protein